MADVDRNPTAPSCFEEFGRAAFECLKECISEGGFDCDAETLAELAVKAGLMVREPYDPERHNLEYCDHDYEPGEMIYYWGKPSGISQTCKTKT